MGSPPAVRITPKPGRTVPNQIHEASPAVSHGHSSLIRLLEDPMLASDSRRISASLS